MGRTISRRTVPNGGHGPQVPPATGMKQNNVSKQPIQLPVELWWKVIDFAVDNFSYDENGRAQLRELARVSRAWCTRCRLRAEERLDIIERNKTEVHQLIKRLDEHPERYSVIKRVHFVNHKINNFGSFAVRMAGKLVHVERLYCGNHGMWPWCEWDPGQLHAHGFLHVRVAFESVTTLHLFGISFPSAAVFGRLLSALPRLASLTCEYVLFKKRGIVRATGPCLLRTVDLNSSPGVIDFLVTTGAGTSLRYVTVCGPVEAWSSLVVTAAPSLSSLHISPTDYSPGKYDGTGLLPNLTLAQNLRILSIDLFPAFDPRQLVATLPRASLPSLDEIGITALQSDDSIKVDDSDNDSYTQIDRVLSGRRFPTLRKVTLHLRCRVAPGKAMDVTSEVSWRIHLSSKLPLLHASGRLL
ncbi:uncharacterized protein FIBRA_01903 [Fibroporia radiculosa]|uniref:F-box domain-containing protein n=1 Tax=Fibroporia radiculosa TaxID=599839 RepID=J4G188_9APHY|nr:uncharacterized protein FIBRA_01903 [Fibroporia radiculosa]CCL99878.1 predicted protein [Fibroporia radiculosa]